MKRIILLGLPKCGTVSFTESLINTGYTAGHWINEKGEHLGKLVHKAWMEGKPLLEYIPEYEAITQMDYMSIEEGMCIFPQVYNYQLLLKQYPDALFILNYRNIDNHVRSILTWGDLKDRFYHFKIFNIRKFIKDHNTNIRKHFTGRDNFMQVNIEYANNAAISRFIGYDFTMTHKNKTTLK